ncbi:hypothetical protein M413DRAFT_31350 [Hebeloma cylindrosporum]|uniref:Uncharacterized protein n=1 Tax=Hebeloma cylindrosporum TaxID=76867 RepID=A0A0C2XGD1_HEBCY|nr:hypothetical protein M413DRAFT_31350 [Hebeloma cylindrosporum h7]
MNVVLPHFSQKRERYRRAAQRPNIPGPPESKWYGILENELHKNLVQRSVPSRSTRYADFALIDILPNNHATPHEPLVSLREKVLIILEVKPPPARPSLEKKSWDDAKGSAWDQLQHHFWALPRDSAAKVIVIAAVADEWIWAVFQRVAGATPASSSDRAAVPYKDEHGDIAVHAHVEGRITGWSSTATLGEADSDIALNEVLQIMANLRLLQ